MDGSVVLIELLDLEQAGGRCFKKVEPLSSSTARHPATSRQVEKRKMKAATHKHGSSSLEGDRRASGPGMSSGSSVLPAYAPGGT